MTKEAAHGYSKEEIEGMREHERQIQRKNQRQETVHRTRMVIMIYSVESIKDRDTEDESEEQE